MDEKLLPCPRCGGEMSVYQADGYTWDVMCNGPECLDEKVFTTREQAVAAANRRTPGPATAKMLAKLHNCGTAPDFRGIAGVNLILTSHEAAAFLAEHEPAKPESS